MLDSVANIEDMAAVREMACRSARFGFDGATCVHPSVVGVLNDAFSPSAEDVAWALKTVEVMELAYAREVGAAWLDGRVIDRPMLMRARKIVAKAKKCRA